MLERESDSMYAMSPRLRSTHRMPLIIADLLIGVSIGDYLGLKTKNRYDCFRSFKVDNAKQDYYLMARYILVYIHMQTRF